MKLAYVGYDTHVLKAHSVLSKSFTEIEYFLVKNNESAFHVDFEKVSLFFDSVCIPYEDELKTSTHQALYKKIEQQCEQFKKEIFGTVTDKQQSIAVESQKSSQMIHPILAVQDIFFDSKKNKVIIEKQGTGVSEYDFILVENHQLLADSLKELKGHPFADLPKNSHVWFSMQFHYELLKPRDGVLPESSFFLIKDSVYESLVDNWYFCHFDQQILTVQQWVPFNQYQNQDYKKFIIERTREALVQKLAFIHLADLKADFVDTTAGFSIKEMSLKNDRLSAVVPSFSFWSERKIENKLSKTMDSKIKKIVKFQSMQRGVS